MIKVNSCKRIQYAIFVNVSWTNKNKEQSKTKTAVLELISTLTAPNWSVTHESMWSKFDSPDHLICCVTEIATDWPGLLEAWLALTSVKYHGNLEVLIPLNQRLALTRLRTTGPWTLIYAHWAHVILYVTRFSVSICMVYKGVFD